MRIDPKHPDAYAGKASIFMMQRDTKRALIVLDLAVELDPQSADSHGNRATVLLSMGQYDKALDDVDDVLKIAPSSPFALRERAWILATCPLDKIRNGDEAVKSASKACELSGWNEPRVLMTLAAACSEARDFDGALKWQQKAIELLPDKSPENASTGGFSNAIRPRSRIAACRCSRKSEFKRRTRSPNRPNSPEVAEASHKKGIRSCRRFARDHCCYSF